MNIQTVLIYRIERRKETSRFCDPAKIEISTLKLTYFFLFCHLFIYLFVILIRFFVPAGISFWPESLFEDFMWLHAVSTARVTALAVFRLTTFSGVTLYSCLQILTMIYTLLSVHGFPLRRSLHSIMSSKNRNERLRILNKALMYSSCLYGVGGWPIIRSRETIIFQGESPIFRLLAPVTQAGLLNCRIRFYRSPPLHQHERLVF